MSAVSCSFSLFRYVVIAAPCDVACAKEGREVLPAFLDEDTEYSDSGENSEGRQTIADTQVSTVTTGVTHYESDSEAATGAEGQGEEEEKGEDILCNGMKKAKIVKKLRHQTGCEKKKQKEDRKIENKDEERAKAIKRIVGPHDDK